MIRKTAELKGPALDWAVAKCEGTNRAVVPTFENPDKFFTFAENYSRSWKLAGPIIEREDIVILRPDDDWGTDAEGFTTSQRIKVWGATIERGGQQSHYSREYECYTYWYSADNISIGPTPLVAAMRCYVASKLGPEIDIPDELA